MTRSSAERCIQASSPSSSIVRRRRLATRTRLTGNERRIADDHTREQDSVMTDQKPDQTGPRTDKAQVDTTIKIEEGGEVRGTVRIASAVLIQLLDTTVRDLPGSGALTSHTRRKTEHAGESPA